MSRVKGDPVMRASGTVVSYRMQEESVRKSELALTRPGHDKARQRQAKGNDRDRDLDSKVVDPTASKREADRTGGRGGTVETREPSTAQAKVGNNTVNENSYARRLSRARSSSR